jgi:hypothetical protein
LLIRSALIDFMFIRLLAALLVAARQFRATKYVVALHCGRSTARQCGQQARCVSFGTGLLSPVR